MSILFIKIFKFLFFKNPLHFYFYCAIIYIMRVQKSFDYLGRSFYYFVHRRRWALLAASDSSLWR